LFLGGQHNPFLGGQYAPFSGGHFNPFLGGQHERFFQPKPSIHINEDIIRLLSYEISLKIGFRIRSKTDCKSLSLFISDMDLGVISVSTLYRLLV
jgi:hypothetical protein